MFIRLSLFVGAFSTRDGRQRGSGVFGWFPAAQSFKLQRQKENDVEVFLQLSLSRVSVVVICRYIPT